VLTQTLRKLERNGLVERAAPGYGCGCSRASDARDGTLVAAVCPGLVDTAASRPWFDAMSGAQTPAQAAVAPLDVALDRTAVPHRRGELVQFGRVIPGR
jgi:NAD(P)-dependent dehydrogenase (short-subunit alcohol dehydrogenase family)